MSLTELDTSPLNKGDGTEGGNQPGHLHDITEELPRKMPSPTPKRSASGEKLIPRYFVFRCTAMPTTGLRLQRTCEIRACCHASPSLLWL